MTTSDSATTRWGRRATCAIASAAMTVAGLVALAAPASAAGATIYVNAAGADAANCGSQIVQCKTIQAGVDKAQPGDTVLVAAGTYKGLVDIAKGITVKSAAGAATTIIDGAGLNPGNGGVVDIAQPGGDVTFSGFTVTNQAASSNGDAFALTISDTSDADTITVSNNVFPGNGATTDDFVYGVNSLGTAAKQVITENDFSGSSRGILVEGNSGPATISKNTFHDLVTTGAGDGATFPPKAIYFLADGNTGAKDQNVTDNTFRDFAGIGVSIRAGYDLGGCTDQECDGTFAGTASGNTFALTAQAATNVTTDNQQSAAFNVSALKAGDQVDLVLSGNTGTVIAPTQPLVVAKGEGTVNLTPGTAVNKIVPDPQPTVSVPVPANFVTNGEVKTFTGTAVNSADVALPNVRYDLSITGTKGIKASQLKLEYDVDPGEDENFQAVPLTGTANADGAIVGSFGPAAGFTFPAGATLKTDFRLSFPDSATPPDTLKVNVDLVQVSSASGNPAINTLASTSSTTTVSDAPAATVDVSSAALAAQISATDTTAVTATVKNSGGGVLANQTVTFTVDLGFVSTTEVPTSTTTKSVTATTNASGVATAYVGSTSAGTQKITAKSGDVSGTASKSYFANPTSLVLTPESTTLQAGTKQVFTATVKDVVGNPSAGQGVSFSNGAGPGLLNTANATTDANGVATVTLTTATDDTGNGTVTATVFSPAGSPTDSSTYTVTAPTTPVTVASVTPTVVTPLSQPGFGQSVTVKVVNTDGSAPATGTEVDVVVSGATVTNGTVLTNAAGNASFRYVVQHAGSFTVKAFAGGKSGSTTQVAPVRNVTTTLTLTSPSKGAVTATAKLTPNRGAGRTVGFYVVQNSVPRLLGSAVTNSAGVATRTFTNRPSGLYVMTARLYGDPDADSVYAKSTSVRVK